MKTAVLVLLALAVNAFGEVLTATDIIRKSDDLLRGAKSYAKVTMKIERPEWSRSLTMDAWSEGTSNTFIRILEPRREKDVTFLKKGREAWQYVPAIDRTIKVPPSMMLQSWMGSDFTNDDVVRADSIVVDYTHKIVGEPEVDSTPCWIIELTAKENAPVVWGKVMMTVRKDNFVGIAADYFDEDGTKIKTLSASDLQTVEEREVATHLTMKDLSRPGYQTSIAYTDLTFAPKVDKNRFSLRSLKRK